MDKRRSTQVSTTLLSAKKPVPATSAPLSHNQTDPNRPKVWEFSEGTPASSGNGTGISLTVTKAVDGGKQEAEDDASKSARAKARDASSPRRRHGQAAAADGPVETLTYRDPFAGVYKK